MGGVVAVIVVVTVGDTAIAHSVSISGVARGRKLKRTYRNCRPFDIILLSICFKYFPREQFTSLSFRS